MQPVPAECRQSEISLAISVVPFDTGLKTNNTFNELSVHFDRECPEMPSRTASGGMPVRTLMIVTAGVRCLAVRQFGTVFCLETESGRACFQVYSQLVLCRKVGLSGKGRVFRMSRNRNTRRDCDRVLWGQTCPKPPVCVLCSTLENPIFCSDRKCFIRATMLV